MISSFTSRFYKLLFFAVLIVCSPLLSRAQTSFDHNNQTYYLHKLVQFNSAGSSDFSYPNSVAIDDKYVYFADNQSYEEYLTFDIARYNVADGTPASTLSFTLSDYNLYGVPFILLDDATQELTVCFSYIIKNKSREVIIYNIDKETGNVKKEYKASLTGFHNYTHGGYPSASGDLTNGNFELFMPVSNESSKQQDLEYIVFEDGSVTTTRLRNIGKNYQVKKLGVAKALGDGYVDYADNANYHKIWQFSATSSTEICALGGDLIEGCYGLNTFDYNGQNFVVYGACNLKTSTYEFRIGKWTEAAPAQAPEKSITTLSFDPETSQSLTALASISDEAMMTYDTYPQLSASVTLGNNEKVQHIAVLMPGYYFALYQLNMSSKTTNSESIINDLADVDYRIDNKRIIFTDVQSVVEVYNVIGTRVASYRNVSELDLSAIPTGIYIINRTSAKPIRLVL